MIWLTRILLVASLTVQTAVAQATDQPIRVRVTGVHRYDIPDVISIEKNRISGRRPVTRSPSMIRFSRTDGEPAVSVVQPGRRVTGEARRVEGGLLEFISDDDREVSLIPTESIAMIERQKAAIASRETSRGIGLGIGAAIFGLSYLGAMSCQPDESAEGLCWRFFQVLMFVGAPVIGVLSGWSIGRVRWGRVTIDELRAEFAAAGSRCLRISREIG